MPKPIYLRVPDASDPSRNYLVRIENATIEWVNERGEPLANVTLDFSDGQAKAFVWDYGRDEDPVAVVELTGQTTHAGHTYEHER